MHHVSTTLRARLRRGCALGGCSLGLRVSPAPPMHHVNTTLRSRLCFDGCGLGLRVIHPASLIHSRSRWAVHQRLAGHHCSRCPALYGTAATALHHHCRRCSCSPPPPVLLLQSHITACVLQPHCTAAAAAVAPHPCVHAAEPHLDTNLATRSSLQGRQRSRGAGEGVGVMRGSSLKAGRGAGGPVMGAG